MAHKFEIYKDRAGAFGVVFNQQIMGRR